MYHAFKRCFKFKILLQSRKLSSCMAKPAPTKFSPTVLVHGGAGFIADFRIPGVKSGVKRAAGRGYTELVETGSALNAVEAAVKALEEDGHFNAGYGSVLTLSGDVEMDASIMDGAQLAAGSVSVVCDIKHPISLARRVMEKTQHIFLAGEGAMQFAEKEGVHRLPKHALVTEASQQSLKSFKSDTKKHRGSMCIGPPGTVGAVAIDRDGNMAAATSTGGITGKLSGRIGDSALLGAGTYADNSTGAVSATGHGETIMRYNVASRILGLVEHNNYSVQIAAEEVLKQIKVRFNEMAGIIGIDRMGQLGICFTSNRMSWAYRRGNELHCGVDAGEHNVEVVKSK